MDFRRKAFARSTLRLAGVAAALLFAQIFSASAAGAQQTAPPRRPSGPAAGPVIKLPPGSGASLEQTQSNSKEHERAAAEPKRWEYCAIVGINWRQKNFPSNASTPSAVIRFFPNTLEEVEGGTEDDALANAFARLGDEGWELTGISTNFSLTDGSGKTSSAYYFKRPKRHE